MHRCLRSLTAASRLPSKALAPAPFLAPFLALFLALACISPQTSAQVARPFPPEALRGEMAFGQPPEVTLNGQPTRLAPGARIRGEDNLLRMSASLVGRTATVHYTLEPATGQPMNVWILRREEAAVQPWPRTPEEAARWTFDPAAQTWTRR